MLSDEQWDEAFEKAEPEKEGETQPGQTSEGGVFNLKYLGEVKTVGRDEAITLAQKGMDYDRIRERYEQLKTTAAASSGDPAAAKQSADIDEFLADYPQIDPKEIPVSVWREVKNGKSLSAAYAKWEIAQLKTQMEASRQNEAAMIRSTGSRSTTGGGEEQDEFLRFLLDE